MSVLARVSVAALAVCATWTAASATTILTTSLAHVGPTSSLCCTIVNVGKKDVEVLIGFRAPDGTIPFADGLFALPPGTAQTPCVGGVVERYCRFELVKGGASSVRASSCVRVFTQGGDGSCTGGEPAR
jgi:hypothetical protein